MEKITKKTIALVKHRYFLISKKRVRSWVGFIFIFIGAGIVLSIFFSILQNLEKIAAQSLNIITNQATITYEDSGKKTYGPIVSNSTNTNIEQPTPTATPTPSKQKDTTPPGRTTDLALVQSAPDTFVLHWTTPGDDDMSGKADSYDIRSSTTGITTDTWTLATPLLNPPKPQDAGNAESFTVSNLLPNTTYYFALKTLDETGNESLLSNVAIGSAGDIKPFPTDTIAPAKIITLLPTAITDTSVGLVWQAPGDDELTGTASTYIIRYDTKEIKDDASWTTAINALNPPTPQVALSKEIYTLANMQTNIVYYIAMRATDEAGNISPISNVIKVQTITSVQPKDATKLSIIKAIVLPESGYKRDGLMVKLKMKKSSTKEEIIQMESKTDADGNVEFLPNNVDKATIYDLTVYTELCVSYTVHNFDLKNAEIIPITIQGMLIGNLQDADNMINDLDYAAWSATFGTSDPKGDLNKDTISNVLDAGFINKNFGLIGTEN